MTSSWETSTVCPNCGGAWDLWACGPGHALGSRERAEHRRAGLPVPVPADPGDEQIARLTAELAEASRIAEQSTDRAERIAFSLHQAQDRMARLFAELAESQRFAEGYRQDALNAADERDAAVQAMTAGIPDVPPARPATVNQDSGKPDAPITVEQVRSVLAKRLLSCPHVHDHNALDSAYLNGHTLAVEQVIELIDHGWHGGDTPRLRTELAIRRADREALR